MKKRVLIVALGLAAALFVFGQTSAKADHCRGGGFGGGHYGGGYSGGYYGGIGYAPVYRAAPVYNYGYIGGYNRGFDHHHQQHGYYRGRGYGNSIRVLTPGFSFGLYR